jgi:hypothetical protein
MCVAILKKQKCHFFSFYKNQRILRQNRSCLVRLVPVGGGRRWRKAWGDEYSTNTVYPCMPMQKMRPAETIPGMRKGRIKENIEGSEFKYDIFDMF